MYFYYLTSPVNCFLLACCVSQYTFTLKVEPSAALLILNRFRAVYTGFIILARRRFAREFIGLITRGEWMRGSEQILYWKHCYIFNLNNKKLD